MAFRLTQSEDVAEGIRRICVEQLERALRELASDDGDLEVHVHEARKCLKRLRGVLRLIRGALGREIFVLENTCYRDAARQLAEMRDATALLETVARLEKYAGRRIRRGKFATVKRWLEQRREDLHRAHTETGDVRRRVLDELRWARRRVDEWPLARADGTVLLRGMRRVYERGRRELRHASATWEDAGFHEWRKSAKHLWYHVQVLADTWPGMMSALADQLDELADTLGQDHDLTVLRQTVMGERTCPIRASTLQALLELIEDRQGHLRTHAQKLGRRLYAERARDFARRMRAYWRTWRAEAPVHQASRLAPSPIRSAQPEPVADYACETGEGPLWHPLERRVYWVDIPTGRMFWYDPERGVHQQCLRAPAALGGFTIQADGALLLFMARGAVAMWRDGRLDYIVEERAELLDTRFNDVIADPVGRVFCGTMPGPDHAARLYRLDPDGSLTAILDDVGLANGMGFSPDRRFFYFTDTTRSLIRRFMYDEASGSITEPAVFVDSSSEPGMPDGLTVDAEGCVWSARWDGACVIRYSPAGEELERLPLPVAKVTSVTFAGDRSRDMYITTAGGRDKDREGAGAGALFRVRVAVAGLPEYLSRIEP